MSNSLFLLNSKKYDTIKTNNAKFLKQMSIENANLCKRMPVIPEKSFIEKLSEFATFTEKGKQELAAKHKAEQEELNAETRRLCAAELQERADKDLTVVNFPMYDKVINPNKDLGGMF